jgi:hypothetical protein
MSDKTPMGRPIAESQYGKPLPNQSITIQQKTNQSLSYSNIVTLNTKPTMVVNPYASNTVVNNQSVPKVITPLCGLGGGLPQKYDEEKIKKLEMDMVMLQQAINKTTNTVQSIDNTIQDKLKTMDDKIENSVSTIMVQIEEKIEQNNGALQDKFSVLFDEKLKYNNKQNNSELLAGLKELMDMQFVPINEHNHKSDIKINNMQINQEMINTKLFAKLEANNNTMKSIINSDNGPSISKLIKTNRFITRASVAKNLLNATKISTQTGKDAKTITTNKENEGSMNHANDNDNMEYYSDEDEETVVFETTTDNEQVNHKESKDILTQCQN